MGISRWRGLSIMLAGVAWLMTASLDICSAALGNFVLSVITDKEVYSYLEPVRVEAVAMNPTDDFLAISVAPPYYRTLLVVDVTTGATVYQRDDLAIPNNFAQVLTPHAQVTFAITEVPAYTLKAGKKYNVLLNLSLKLKHQGPTSTVTDILLSNPGTVITVK